MGNFPLYFNVANSNYAGIIFCYVFFYVSHNTE